jgi:hypothetical protein
MRSVFFVVSIPLAVGGVACSGQFILGDMPDAAGVNADGGDPPLPDASIPPSVDAAQPDLDAALPIPDVGPVRIVDAAQPDADAAAPADGVLHTFTSIADTSARLQGTWLTCGGQILAPADTVGIEFNGPMAYFLVQGPAATIVRGAGPAYERSVTIIDTTNMNGPGWYQIDFLETDIDGATGGNAYFAQSFDAPSKLRLTEGTTGNVADYLAAPGQLDAGAAQCSLMGGTWDVTMNAFYGTNASFQFLDSGSFVGGPLSASLPESAIYSGFWSVGAWLDDAGESANVLSLWNSVGMNCNEWDTFLDLSYSADCGVATLVDFEDGCTGARNYFDGTTVLTRR